MPSVGTGYDAGVWKHPDGDAYYAQRIRLFTTLDMTPEEIHQLGLSEVARIRSEMQAIIDEGGVIVRIQKRTVPYSLQAIYSGQPVTAVLELNAGTTSRLSIKPGDRVIHTAFGSGS